MPRLAIDILEGMVTDQTMPLWCAGDEVNGRRGGASLLAGP